MKRHGATRLLCETHQHAVLVRQLEPAVVREGLGATHGRREVGRGREGRGRRRRAVETAGERLAVVVRAEHEVELLRVVDRGAVLAAQRRRRHLDDVGHDAGAAVRRLEQLLRVDHARAGHDQQRRDALCLVAHERRVAHAVLEQRKVVHRADGVLREVVDLDEGVRDDGEAHLRAGQPHDVDDEDLVAELVERQVDCELVGHEALGRQRHDLALLETCDREVRGVQRIERHAQHLERHVDRGVDTRTAAVHHLRQLARRRRRRRR